MLNNAIPEEEQFQVNNFIDNMKKTRSESGNCERRAEKSKAGKEREMEQGTGIGSIEENHTLFECVNISSLRL